MIRRCLNAVPRGVREGVRASVPGLLARRLAVGGALLSALAWAPPAWAQMESREGIALQNQIMELRRDLQAMRDQGGGGGVLSGRAPSYDSGSGGELVPQMLARVQAMEDEVRGLRGRVDELQNAQQRQYQELAKQIGDLSFRLGAAGTTSGGSGGTAPPSYPSPAAPPVRPADPPAAQLAAPGGPRTPERGIAEASAAIGRRDYSAAEAAAREVLQTSRMSPRAYDAQFLLAEALAGKREYPQAAVAYDDAYNRSKTGSHAAESLVGLASSLSAIGEKRAACETLGKLAHEFPAARPGVREAAAAVRQRAACQ